MYRSILIFTGRESSQEMAQKMVEFQRSIENRLAALEKKEKELDDRLQDVED